MFIYAFTIFLGAFLIFQVQPFIGKYILPWFGGTPSVWSTCMLFFQTLLLGGYLYAHLLVTRFTPRQQGILHSILLLAGVVVIAGQWFAWGTPILPGDWFKPEDSDLPTLRLLTLLIVSVGLPYFILSSTGPLVQAWFCFSQPGRSPYRLYTLSNIGSLLALVSYPFIIEPMLKLKYQADIWAVMYGLFAGGLILLGLRIRNDRSGLKQTDEKVPENTDEVVSPPRWSRRLQWFGLAAAASSMLLAATNQICQEIAVMPFLWVLPLTLYLLSFIIVFNSDSWYSRKVWGILFLVATGVACAALFDTFTLPIWLQIVVFSALLFTLCMVCHGEMVALRPHPRYLTSFYLMMSAGGAFGGAFVSLLAPLIFNGFWELHLSLWAAWALFVIVLWQMRSDWVNSPGMSALKKVSLGFLLVLAVALYGQTRYANSDAIYCERGFYGVLRVRQMAWWDLDRKALKLSHGAIVHGFQYTAPEKSQEPASYYGENSGIALALRHFPEWLEQRAGRTSIRVGVVGLGVGTLAAFGKTGDYYRFYEINPGVTALSMGDEPYFTYLQESSATIDVVDGDARISMERELAAGDPQNFDVIAIDAFSSDSIPAHLLTREALKVYRRHLLANGVIAMHISNRHLDLRPVVTRLASQEGLHTVIIEAEDDDEGHWSSTWVLVTENKDFLAMKPLLKAASDDKLKFEADIWTDDYSNIYQILN
jgi:hypothetical protein